MNIQSSFMFAKRMIFPRTGKASDARRSIIGAIACIAISVIPLVVVITVSDGMFSGMTSRIVNLSSGHVQVLLNRNSSIVKNYESFRDFSKTFLEIKNVKNAFPEIESDSLAFSKTYRTGAKIRAVEPELFFECKEFSSLFSVKDGSLENFGGKRRTCVIGEKIASTLALHSGDKIRLVTSSKVASFEIAAVVSSGYQELDALWVFIPLETSYGFLTHETSMHSVKIMADDTSMKSVIALQRSLEDSYQGIIRAYRWDEVNASKFENFSSTRLMLVLIMFMIVLVASVNISSALVMLVMERRREIAILKSCGGSSKGISTAFLLVGGFSGFLGLILGLPVGLLCSVNVNSIVRGLEFFFNQAMALFCSIPGRKTLPPSHINLMDPAYYLQEIPIEVSFLKLFLIAFSVIFLSLIVSIIPSVKAGRERPVESFRKV